MGRTSFIPARLLTRCLRYDQSHFTASTMTKQRRLEQHIEAIARWIVECEHIVVFTGAGISTDSGIPDFRGPVGVWTRREAGLSVPRRRGGGHVSDRCYPNRLVLVDDEMGASTPPFSPFLCASSSQCAERAGKKLYSAS